MTHEHNKLVRFAQLLARSQERITIEPDKAYQQITVRLWGKGVVERGVIQGSQIAAPSQFVARPGQFIISRIDARNGAFGLVPATLDGAVVTNDFPIFFVNTEEILPEFLAWMSKTQRFVDLCIAASEGTTNRVRLQEERFLATEITLPPLDEQRRIVARIEALAGRVAEAQRLRAEAITAVETVSRAILFSEDGWQATPTPMRELVNLRPTDVTVEPEQVYEFAGVYSFGRGVFRSQSKTGAEFAYKRLSMLRTGNFVYPKLMAWEGALGIVPPECDGCVVSPEFPVFEVNLQRVLPEVLDTYFKTRSVWSSLAGNSTGTNVRRRRLHPDEFLTYLFPLPPMHVQVRLKEIKDRLKPVTALQLQTEAELEALLPAILDKAFRGKL